MEKETTYMNLPQLAKKLEALTRTVESGELNVEQINEMAELSRQLYERAIVLQFKAFEKMVGDKTDEGIPADAPPPDESPKEFTRTTAPLPEREKRLYKQAEPKVEEDVKEPMTAAQETEAEPVAEPGPVDDPAPEVERMAFRLDDGALSPKQISLIDSIEEIKKMEHSINDTYKDQPVSLGDAFNRKPIAKLKAAITINQKFKFIAELFQGDAEAFGRSIEKLDASHSFIEADDYIQNSLRDRYEWEMKSPTVKTFLSLVERRFL